MYTTGASFTVAVVVNTEGESVNAAEGTISFNPRELSVVSVNRSSSIFSLWVTEPTFSNSAGTISFSGGSPGGYKGGGGTVMSITLRATNAGTPKLSFTSGAVLANDGRGTNVLSGMKGGTYTIGAATSAPAPEVIEYVAPANTPRAPRVTSSTHPDERLWYAKNEAALAWELPSGVTAVRTLLDRSPSTIPTKVYDQPLRNITLSDLPDGVSYFHVQFQNADGWGGVTHYRLAVDRDRPTSLILSLPEGADLNNPAQTLIATAVDATSRILRYRVRIDATEPFDVEDKEATGRIVLPALPPGYHTAIIEAFDEAGNSIIESISFTTVAFAAPVFTAYPEELNAGVIPVIRGTTRASSTVVVTLTPLGADFREYTVRSDSEGNFTFIPEQALGTGVYELSARATDSYGAQSDTSVPVRIAVQEPGLLRIGTFLVSVMSIVLSLLGLLILTIMGTLYTLRYVRQFRRRLTIESKEVSAMARQEFATLRKAISQYEVDLLDGRRGGKLTRAESAMLEDFQSLLSTAERRVEKEAADVEHLAEGTSSRTTNRK